MRLRLILFILSEDEDLPPSSVAIMTYSGGPSPPLLYPTTSILYKVYGSNPTKNLLYAPK